MPVSIHGCQVSLPGVRHTLFFSASRANDGLRPSRRYGLCLVKTRARNESRPEADIANLRVAERDLQAVVV
jgi:hypothetical protein